MPHRAPQHFSTVLRFIQASLALPSMPCMPCKLLCIALYVAVPKMLFREHLRARFWHRLGLESCWGSGVSQPCPALYLAVAHASGTALGLNPAGDPVFRNHARPCSTGLFHGIPVHLNIYLGLLSMPCMACIFALYCLALAVPKMLFREHLCARFWHRLGLESCWGSGVSEPCPTVRHTAFPRYSGSSQHLWLCPTATHHPFRSVLPCMPLVVPKMLFRKHLCVCFWHRLGLESCWGSLVSHACPTQPFQEELASAWGMNPGGDEVFRNHASQCSTRLEQSQRGFRLGFRWCSALSHPSVPCNPVHPNIYGFALYALYMYCLVLVHLYLAVLKMLFRAHLCPGLWRRLGASSVIQPCLTVLHKAFPWYWPVHPDIYGFAMYALYALYCLL